MEPTKFILVHYRVGPTVYFGPFNSVADAARFQAKYRVGQIIPIITPEEAVNDDGTLNLKVWE